MTPYCTIKKFFKAGLRKNCIPQGIDSTQREKSQWAYLQSWQKVLGTPCKTSQNWIIVKNALRKSAALFISHCFGNCRLPSSPQAMLKVPAMILGVQGPPNQHCIAGGGGMCEFATFLQKCPKTFGKDCSKPNKNYGFI